MRYLSLTALFAVLVAFVSPFSVQSAANDAAWGDVKGRIVWAGANLPVANKINVNKDAQHCLANGPLFTEQWVVDKNSKGIRYVVVWLAPEPNAEKKPLAIHPNLQNIKDKEVTLDQPCCAFVPHTLALRQGQDVVVKNSSPVVHNVRWTGHPLKNPGGSIIIPAKQSYTIKGLQAQKLPLPIACDIHSWMNGYLAVFDHPYFAVTDENGNFEIKNAPAGDCRLMIWHDTGWLGGADGAAGKKIAVKAGGATDMGKIDWK